MMVPIRHASGRARALLVTFAMAAGLVLVPVGAAAQVNELPQAQPDVVHASPGEPIVIDVLANDSDPDGDPLSIVAVDGTATITADNKISYIAGFEPYTNEQFTYYITDLPGEGARASATVTVKVVLPIPGNWDHCRVEGVGADFSYTCEYTRGDFTYHYRLYEWIGGEVRAWQALDSGNPAPVDSNGNGVPDQVDDLARAFDDYRQRLVDLGFNTPPHANIHIRPGDTFARCAAGAFYNVYIPSTRGAHTAGHELFHLAACTYTNWDPTALTSPGQALYEATAEWFSGGGARRAEFLASSRLGILDSNADKRQYGAHILFEYAPPGTVKSVYQAWGGARWNDPYYVLGSALPADTMSFFAGFWASVHRKYSWPAESSKALTPTPTRFNIYLGPGGGAKYDLRLTGPGKLHIVVPGWESTNPPRAFRVQVLLEDAGGGACQDPVPVSDHRTTLILDASCRKAVVILSNDLLLTDFAAFTASFEPAPPAPTVNGGANRHITSSTTTLSPVVTYAGRLSSWRWTKVSGPGTVWYFPSPLAPNAKVTFGAPGTYRLEYRVKDEYGREASDSLLVSFDKVPVVNAGPDLVTTTGKRWINATVTDDGGSPITYAWSSYGPGSASFSNPYGIDTTATLSTPGTYTLRLTARDGKSTRSDTTRITYDPPPVVDAGPDRTTTRSYTWPFATVSNQVGSLSIWWSKVSGPGTVAFSCACAQPKMTFSRSGTYTLRLTASDGRSTKSDLMRVTVNKPPTPNAGSNRTVYSRYTPVSVKIYGSTSDDWVSTVTRTWSKVSGPGTVWFSPTTSTSTTRTTARFYAFGTYKLRLKVTDGVSTRYDYVYVYVRRSSGGGGGGGVGVI